MKSYSFRPNGVCSRSIHIELDQLRTVKRVTFEGGCDGNLQGLSQLALNRSADEVIRALRGIRCGHKKTSCPDQLAFALEQAMKEGLGQA